MKSLFIFQPGDYTSLSTDQPRMFHFDAQVQVNAHFLRPEKIRVNKETPQCAFIL